VRTRGGGEGDGQWLTLDELSDAQLEEELTIAASAPDHLRIDRYEQLLAEAQDRGLVRRGGKEAD
jgi:hypothetical protein